MRVLAIDSSETECSAALYSDGVTQGRRANAPRAASELILVMMSQLLDEAGMVPAQLDGIAFGRGPGAFTGLRIAAGVAQGAAFAADLPVAPISSLRALAQGAFRTDRTSRVLAAMDARMDEVYWVASELDSGSGTMQIIGDERVSGTVAVVVPERQGDWTGVGSGWSRYRDSLAKRVGQVGRVLAGRQVDAVDVAVLGAELLAAGGGVAAEKALPVYLRDQVTGQA